MLAQTLIFSSSQLNIFECAINKERKNRRAGREKSISRDFVCHFLSTTEEEKEKKEERNTIVCYIDIRGIAIAGGG